MAVEAYGSRVFINVPFDSEYRPVFDAIIFGVADSGYVPCCARERDDGGEIRFEKLADLIGGCRFGVHDISRTQLDPLNGLPRFNMPLELGLFFGAKWFESKEQKTKRTLILDVEKYRYQKFISDISGQDIKEHQNQPAIAIKAVRNWLAANSAPGISLPTGDVISRRYQRFSEDLPKLCEELRFSREEITFLDYRQLIGGWLKTNPW